MTLAERLGKIRPQSYQDAMARLEARVELARRQPVEGALVEQAEITLGRAGAETFWAGLLAQWARWFPGQDVLGEELTDILVLKDLVSNGAVLDVTELDHAPAIPLAILRPDMVLVTPAADPDRLEAILAELGIDNVIVAREPVADIAFQEIICRDQRPAQKILRRSQRWIGLGGRWFLVRRQREEMGADGRRLVQTIAMSGPRWVMHFAGVPDQPEVSAILATGTLLLDRIEAEMKAIGFWTENPPPMPEIQSYLDAPSFELWLQCVFLPNAREAVALDEWPAGSQVSDIARRQYDYHSFVPEAQRLMEWLRAFDLLVAERNSPGVQPTAMQAVTRGGRLLTKGKWREPEWFSVDVTPFEAGYFPKAIGWLAENLEVTVSSGDDWEYVVCGWRVRARMEYRQSCSIACESQAVRDLIFRALIGLAF